jgi:hypothetical protein
VRNGAPGGREAEVLPPAEKRIAIGGKFLDEVRIRQGPTSYLVFPVESHGAVGSDDDTATVHAKMAPALQHFAEGRLNRIGGEPVELTVGSRKLGPMVLVEVLCGGDRGGYDGAVLVFEPAEQ